MGDQLFSGNSHPARWRHITRILSLLEWQIFLALNISEFTDREYHPGWRTVDQEFEICGIMLLFFAAASGFLYARERVYLRNRLLRGKEKVR